MKRHTTAITVILVILLALTACAKNADGSVTPTPTESKKPLKENIAVGEADGTANKIGERNMEDGSENINESKKGPANNKTPEASDDINDTLKTEHKITYENSNLGFKLSFPVDWKDHYWIDETPKDHIGVYFTGQSARSKGENGEGLLMFFVFAVKINDTMFLDSIKEIGNAHGSEYYYATGTDAPIGVLYIDDDEIIDDDEKELIQNDFAKYSSMTERDVIDSILETFEEIPFD